MGIGAMIETTIVVNSNASKMILLDRRMNSGVVVVKVELR